MTTQRGLVSWAVHLPSKTGLTWLSGPRYTRHTHVRTLTVAGDAIYVPDYHYSDRSGVILWALINVRLQEFSQLRSTGRLSGDFTLLPRL